VSGSHPADLHAGIRRFFQYGYRLRIINPDAIGTDVRIPDIALHYRVNSRIDGNSAVQGRDLLYYLPPQVIRVESMVPDGATDIRDASGASFADIDTLSFRAGVFNIVGLALMAFGGLMVLLVLIRLARGARKWTPAAERQLSTGRMLGAATRELAAVRSERSSAGWTDELIDRALAATRVAAAGALDRAISQRTAAADASVGEGRLVTGGPGLRSKRIVSASATAYDVSRALARLSVADSRRGALESLREALATLTAAQYGRAHTRDESILDEALEAAAKGANSIRAQHVFPRVLLRRWMGSAAPLERRA
jgi:hypothetical protein